jgi:hypothetical protein
VKGPYSVELEALPKTYAEAVAEDPAQMKSAIAALGRRPAAYVGSGGTMVLALLAARLHERCCHQPARAMTSLELLDMPPTRRGAALFTSSAKHPDAKRVLQEFRRGRFSPAAVITHRSREDITELTGPEAEIVELPPLPQTDGFLATGSILQIAVMLLRGFLPGVQLPPEIALDLGEIDVREEILVLGPPSLISVAADIEVRLVESGLATVQVADFRNFAHGRHTGFHRRRDRTTVIVLSDSESEELASATADLLPKDADVRRWHHDGPWPVALIHLLLRSMRLVADIGNAKGADPARPKVPVYGRHLYRLPLAKRVPPRLLAGVDRKLLAMGAGEPADLREFFHAAGEHWAASLGEQRFGGVALDYDGTVCWTKLRRQLPAEPVRTALVKLLSEGIVVGFASGRGKSLHFDLRKWIPKQHWPQVITGLYNGAVCLGLEEELPDLRPPTQWSRGVVLALETLFLRERIEIEERGAQVTVSVCDGLFHDGRLAELLRAELSAAGIEAQVVASGHSVDVVAATTAKTAIADMVRARVGGSNLLAIGDRGEIGGNDHALLAWGQWSLTVDRGSADPTRCWFGGSGDRVGPDLLLQYLKNLKRRRDGFAMKGLQIQ